MEFVFPPAIGPHSALVKSAQVWHRSAMQRRVPNWFEVSAGLLPPLQGRARHSVRAASLSMGDQLADTARMK